MPEHVAPFPGSPLRLRSPGDLIAAVPVLMGFHPRSSLVAIALGGAAGGAGGAATGGRVGLTVRIDLPAPGREAAGAATAVDAVLTGRPVEVVVLVISPPHPTGVPPAVVLVDLVAAGLRTRGVAVPTSLWAGGTAVGDPWRCYGSCGCSGLVPDPASSEAMARSVTLGRVVAHDRAELAHRVAVADPAALRRREALLVERIDGMLGGRPDEAGVAERLVDTAVAAAAAGVLVLDDERIVELAVALGEPAVRDAAVRHCLGPDAAVAADLWATLARETPDPEAAVPAALVALSALLVGAGAMAQVALDRAEQAWPGHRLSRLVRGLVDARIDPSALRACLVGPGLDPAPAVRGGRVRR